MRCKYITLRVAQNLIDRYIAAGGEATTIHDGGVGLGTVLLTNNGLKLKEFVIEEYYINEWNSGHKLISYSNGLPKKWQLALERFWESDLE